jgi:hypothetical protein
MSHSVSLTRDRRLIMFEPMGINFDSGPRLATKEREFPARLARLLFLGNLLKGARNETRNFRPY